MDVGGGLDQALCRAEVVAGSVDGVRDARGGQLGVNCVDVLLAGEDRVRIVSFFAGVKNGEVSTSPPGFLSGLRQSSGAFGRGSVPTRMVSASGVPAFMCEAFLDLADLTAAGCDDEWRLLWIEPGGTQAGFSFDEVDGKHVAAAVAPVGLVDAVDDALAC